MSGRVVIGNFHRNSSSHIRSDIFSHYPEICRIKVRLPDRSHQAHWLRDHIATPYIRPRIIGLGYFTQRRQGPGFIVRRILYTSSHDYFGHAFHSARHNKPLTLNLAEQEEREER